MAKWFEQFFDGLYGRVLANQFEEARTLRQALLVKRLLRARKGQSVLDIPCGMGRLTLPLARAGLAMTGVDLTASYLARARRAARREELDVRFIQGDMRRIGFDGEFDAAFNWFGSFGYFSDEENLDFCRRVLRALRPGGRFLVECPNKSTVIRHFRSGEDETIGGVRIVTRNRWDPRTSRVRATWTFRRANARERHSIRVRLFTGAEMRALLSEAGFRGIHLLGNPPLGPFTRHSRRLLAVAQRPSR